MTPREHIELFELYERMCEFKTATPEEEKIRFEAAQKVRTLLLSFMEAVSLKKDKPNE